MTDSRWKLSHCGFRRGVLTHENGSHLSTSALRETVLLYPFSWITFLRQVNNRDEPESKWGTRLAQRLVETLPCCECMNITRPHMLATCYLFFTVPPQTAAERLFNTFLLVLIWPSCIFFGTNSWRIVRDFLYFCIWLLTNLEGTVSDFCRTSMHILYEQIQLTSPLHCLFFVLQ